MPGRRGTGSGQRGTPLGYGLRARHATDFDKKAAGFSPDRVDALVRALTDLLVEPTPGEAIIEYYRLRAREAAEKKAAAEAAERHPAT